MTDNATFYHEDSYYLKESWQGFISNPASPLDDGTKYILQEAEKLGITWREIPGTELLELTYQGIVRPFNRRIPFQTAHIAFQACLDKSVTRCLLQDKGISVAKGIKITKRDTPEDWQKTFDVLAKPLVVKPTHASHGDAITIGVTTYEEFKVAVEKTLTARPYPEAGATIEETVQGNEYRILATPEKIIAVMYRIPANVIGDGQKTIQQLIEIKNSDPHRGTHVGALFRPIDLNDDVRANLTEQQLTLDSVIPAGKQVFVRKVSNISKGGDAIDMTDEIHPSVQEIITKTVAAIPGLLLAGIDFMTKDIHQPQTSESYAIIEINASAELAIHDFPMVGQNRHACQEFLQIMFPELKHEQNN